jgi:hypothetical protein
MRNEKYHGLINKLKEEIEGDEKTIEKDKVDAKTHGFSILEHMNGKKQIITVFGNETEKRDSLAVRLVPDLSQRFKHVEFRIQDPTESIEPPSDPWVILDVAIGIDEVMVIEDLSELEQVRGNSVHDFDVYMELRLKEKLGQLPKVKIVVIPNQWQAKQALKQVEMKLGSIISTQM